jgi:glycosyltransferase involved in cell wall biosynthesis
MRILHTIDHLDFRRGGPSTAIVDLSHAMAELGHEVAVAALHGPDVPAAWRGTACSPRAIDLPSTRTPLLSRNAREILRAEIATADVVHLHGVWEPLNAQVARLARRAAVPYVISLRGMLDDWSMAQRWFKKRVYWQCIARSMLAHAEAVHCTATLELRQSRKWFPEHLGRVLPNLINLRQFNAMPGAEPARARWPQLRTDTPKLLFLSRLSSKKGLDHLIDAAAQLHKQGTPVAVFVAGTGDDVYEQACRTRSETLGIAQHVHFLGHVGGVDKVSLFEACDLFVLPTSQENFGFVFFEALAAGLPVLTTDLVDTADEIAQSGGGFIVAQDATKIAALCHTLLGDRTELRRRGQLGRAWTFDRLDPARVGREFEAFYRDHARKPVHG